MPQYAFEEFEPHVHEDAFVAPGAVLVGDVHVEAGASIWYGAVLRGDFAPVIVRAGANVQDGAVLHGPPGLLTEVGEGATVAHNCVVHGAILGEECLIANGSVVLDGAVIGARSLVAAGSVVAANTTIAAGMLAAGAPATVKRPLEGTNAAFWVEANPPTYRELAERHRTSIRWLRD